MNTIKSKELYERAVKIMPGGVNSNGRARSPYPIYFKEAQGPYLIDVDGNKYIDLIMGNGSIIFGHNYKPFVDEMNRRLSLNGGMTTGVETEISIEVAEKFLSIVGHERVRFTNSGTEAILHCMHIARAYTGKNDIAVMEGAYNGWNDHVYVNSFASLQDIGPEERPNSVPGMGGMDPKVVESTLVLPFNNIEASEKLIRENAHRLAAIILEPVMIDAGYVEAQKSYIKFLRGICDELGIILLFDELLTGFRIAPGGCQFYYDTKCDLSIFGKALGNGHIIAAVAGKKAVMDECAPGGKTSFVGTFNGHQYSMCAAAAALDLLKDGSVHKVLDARTKYMADRFNESAKKYGVAAVLNGKGGHFHWYFTGKDLVNYRDIVTSNSKDYAVFAEAMQQQNIWMSGKFMSHHAISLSHDDEVIEKLVKAMDKSLLTVANSRK